MSTYERYVEDEREQQRVFRQTEVPNCTCGNKIRPTYVEEQDMMASYDCPVIKCGYCGLSTGVSYPGDEDKVLDRWKSLITQNRSVTKCSSSDELARLVSIRESEDVASRKLFPQIHQDVI